MLPRKLLQFSVFLSVIYLVKSFESLLDEDRDHGIPTLWEELQSFPIEDRDFLLSLLDENVSYLEQVSPKMKNSFLKMMSSLHTKPDPATYKPGDDIAVANFFLNLFQKALPEYYGIADMISTSGDASGTILFNSTDTQTLIFGAVAGISAGLHGIHIHASADCDNLGNHFNPGSSTHGGNTGSPRHMGDLGNFLAVPIPIVNLAPILITNTEITFRGKESVLGRTISIKQNQDDLGQGGNAESLISGNSGPSLYCGVIRSLLQLPTSIEVAGMTVDTTDVIPLHRSFYDEQNGKL